MIALISRFAKAGTNLRGRREHGQTPARPAVNPVTDQTYVANYGGYVTVLTEQLVHKIPLTTQIRPLIGNMTTNPTPTFLFTASSSFAPIAPPVDGLYFQLDTWQGPWKAATATTARGGGFSGTAPPLSLGVHILYAYATDGQDATSIMTTTGSGSSPLVGAISAYLFVIVPPSTMEEPLVSLSPTSIDIGLGLSKSQNVTLRNAGSDVLQTGNIRGHAAV